MPASDICLSMSMRTIKESIAIPLCEDVRDRTQEPEYICLRLGFCVGRGRCGTDACGSGEGDEVI